MLKSGRKPGKAPASCMARTCSARHPRSCKAARAEPGAGRDALQRAELEEVVSHERGERQLGEAEQRGEEHGHDERASDACDLRSAQAAARRRAIRSSSGGCDAKRRMNFVELDIRKAAIAG